MGHAGIKIETSSGEREQLLTIRHSRSLPHSPVRHGRVILMAADGVLSM